MECLVQALVKGLEEHSTLVNLTLLPQRSSGVSIPEQHQVQRNIGSEHFNDALSVFFFESVTSSNL